MTAERVTTAAELDAGVGWYEWIAMPTATTQVAYVHENGSLYLPDGEFAAEDFLLAAAEGRAHRLVRATEVAEAEARGAREALTEASQIVDEAAWLTHPINEEGDYWAALDDVVEALGRLARGERARSCTCPHYVVDHSDPEPRHPENVDREDDPSCPVHGAGYRAPGRRP